MKRGKTKTISDQSDSARLEPVESLEDREPDEQAAATEEAKAGRDIVAPSQNRLSMDELEKKVESLRDSLLRAKADYQNLQRRSLLERTEAICYANGELMRSLLNVLDDLERSLTALEKMESLSPALDGIRLVYENFVKALHSHGLEPIEALHKPFDPQLHEALIQQPSAEHDPGTVLEEVAKGYRLRDRVLRPSKVVVSKAADFERADRPDSNGSEKSNASKKEEDELEAKT